MINKNINVMLNRVFKTPKITTSDELPASLEQFHHNNSKDKEYKRNNVTLFAYNFNVRNRHARIHLI